MVDVVVVQPGKCKKAVALAAPAEPGGRGGGIYNTGTLNLVHTHVSNNSGGDGGRGGNSFVAGGNAGIGGSGGGIYNSGNLNLVDSIIASNSSGNGSDGGDGIFVQTMGSPFNPLGGLAGEGGCGGGIYNTGTLTTERSIITQNSAGRGGLPGTDWLEVRRHRYRWRRWRHLQ